MTRRYTASVINGLRAEVERPHRRAATTGLAVTDVERIELLAAWFVSFRDEINHDFSTVVYLFCSGFMAGYHGKPWRPERPRQATPDGRVRIAKERWHWEAGDLAREMEVDCG